MKNKKLNPNNKVVLSLILFLFFLFLIFVGSRVWTYIYDNNQKGGGFATGCFETASIKSDDYKINFITRDCGHPSGDSFHALTSDLDGIFSKGSVNVSYYFYENESIEDKYKDIDKFESKKINGKNFKYFIEDESKIILIYVVDKNSFFTIEIDGYVEFDSNGNFIEDVKINKGILDSKGIKSNINFTIEKQ